MSVMCRRCNVRWVQRRGVCRTCERALGLDDRTTFERERDRVAAMHVEPAPVPIRLERVIVVDGREMTVVWDGTMRRSIGE